MCFVQVARIDDVSDSSPTRTAQAGHRTGDVTDAWSPTGLIQFKSENRILGLACSSVLLLTACSSAPKPYADQIPATDDRRVVFEIVLNGQKLMDLDTDPDKFLTQAELEEGADDPTRTCFHPSWGVYCTDAIEGRSKTLEFEVGGQRLLLVPRVKRRR